MGSDYDATTGMGRVYGMISMDACDSNGVNKCSGSTKEAGMDTEPWPDSSDRYHDRDPTETRQPDSSDRGYTDSTDSSHPTARQ